MLHLAESHILSIDPYVPESALENNGDIKFWAQLGSNENCLGPGKKAIEAAKQAVANSHRYPLGNRLVVIDKLCTQFHNFNIKNNQIALGNGTSEIIVNLVRGLVGANEQLLFAWPSFIMYKLAAQAHGRSSIIIPVLRDFSYNLNTMLKEANNKNNKVKLIIIANPNNPTGKYLPYNDFKDFILKIKNDIVVAIDEAYFEYVQENDYHTALELALSRPRTIVLRTFSKIYGLAGLRLGYAIGDKDVIAILCRIRDPFNVNNVVQNASIAALDDQEHINQSISHNLLYKSLLTKGLLELGFDVYDSVCNFVLAKRRRNMMSMETISKKLFSQGTILRTLDLYNLHDYVRISVGTKEEIAQLFSGLQAIMREAKEPLLLPQAL
jgi:histidinol-phosphate aminotransferase